jgi:hypothetical protein
MNKETIMAFVTWLDAASLEEIREHQAFVEANLHSVRTPEGRADAKLALRLIDEEILARMSLKWSSRG